MSNHPAIPCAECRDMFTPRSTRQHFCESMECIRARKRKSAKKVNENKNREAKFLQERERLLQIPKVCEFVDDEPLPELSFPKAYPESSKQRYLRLARAVSRHPDMTESKQILNHFLNS